MDEDFWPYGIEANRHVQDLTPWTGTAIFAKTGVALKRA
jgi:hypothetical protein